MGMRRMARLVWFGTVAAGFAAATALAATQTTTQTTLTAETRDSNGRSVASFTATVQSEDGTPATGAVALVERNKSIASAALNAEGKAAIILDSLASGDHQLRAVYLGDGNHAASRSESLVVHPQAASTPDFKLAIAPATLALTPGEAGNLVATVAPVNGFTGFISLSCSGPPGSSGQPGGSSLPIGVTCVFTPANVQLTGPTTTDPSGGVTSDVTVQTTAPAGPGALNHPNRSPSGHPLALAILLPGIAGLGFLSRRRNLLGRTSLVLMIGAVALLGATACSARYRYFHHPPTYNGGTPTGSYTLTITAQTSNGVTATEHTSSLALTVN
jgi:hypothetical protein